MSCFLLEIVSDLKKSRIYGCNKMLSYRRETTLQVRYSFRRKRKTGTNIFTDIIGLSSTTVI